jgi:transposase-like protein
MIDLDKQQQPTQEEIQDFVNKVYDYAVDLYTNQNMSWGEVKQELINQGLNQEDASTVVENLKEQESQAKHEAANKELGYGVLWAVGGVALTALTGGTLIFWGAVVWGGWLILKGMYHKMS